MNLFPWITVLSANCPR